MSLVCHPVRLPLPLQMPAPLQLTAPEIIFCELSLANDACFACIHGARSVRDLMTAGSNPVNDNCVHIPQFLAISGDKSDRAFSSMSQSLVFSSGWFGNAPYSFLFHHDLLHHHTHAFITSQIYCLHSNVCLRSKCLASGRSPNDNIYLFFH